MTVEPNSAVPSGCCARGSRDAMMVIAVGISTPPVNPWPARPITITGRVPATPQSIENAVNSPVAASSRLRSPSSFSSQPARGMMMISATR